MSGLVRVSTNELLTTSTPYPCTWIGWYYEGSFRPQLLHVYYACKIRIPSLVTWNMSLQDLRSLPQVKKVEIFPLHVDSNTLLDIFRDTITGEEVEDYSGWDLVQAQLDEISIQDTKVYILKDLEWQDYYADDSLSLTTNEDILRRYVPEHSNIVALRVAIEERNDVFLADTFNRCFPHYEAIRVTPETNETTAETKEELLPFIRYYESLPPFDTNLKRLHELLQRYEAAL